MLVFRCECEQILGVEDEASKGGLGECPTCGRIIRVPKGLVNASGRLRLAGTPARASASNSGREIKVESGKHRAASPSGAIDMLAVREAAAKISSMRTPAPPLPPIRTPPPPPAPVPAMTTPAPLIPPKMPEPEVIAPIAGHGPDEELDSGLSKATQIGAPWQAKTEIGPVVPLEGSRGFDSDFGLSIPQDSAASAPEVKSSTSGRKEALASKTPKGLKAPSGKLDADDPNAAIETKNDKTLATPVAQYTAQRKRVAPPAPAKKSPLLIVGLVVILVVAVVAALYLSGVIGQSESEPKNSGTGAAGTVNKATTAATTQATTPAATTPAVTPETKVDAPADADKKVDEKKDAAPAEDKKTK